jgi:hypothetical protein
VRVSKKVRQLP